jgi:hypothetical protein
MTLSNMRAQGVPLARLICELCHHAACRASMPGPIGVPVQWFAARIVCTICGIPGADARPSPLPTLRFALS